MIEVRMVADSLWVVSITLGDDESTTLSGPYSTAALAEAEGMSVAERAGVQTLRVYQKL